MLNNLRISRNTNIDTTIFVSVFDALVEIIMALTLLEKKIWRFMCALPSVSFYFLLSSLY